jgi:hypothetical protein
MGMSVAAGFWFWRLTPGERARAVDQSRGLLLPPGGAPAGGLTVAPPGPKEPLYNPAIGKDGLTDEERDRMHRQRAAWPFDAGAAIAQIFGGTG